MSQNLINDNMPKAAIYCRVAMYNKVNIGVNESVIEEQETICREYADSKGYQIKNVFTDFGSGLTLEHEGMNKLIGVIKRREISAVIVKDLARVTRSTIEIKRFNRLCEKHNVSIISALQDTICSTALKKINIF